MGTSLSLSLSLSETGAKPAQSEVCLSAVKALGSRELKLEKRETKKKEAATWIHPSLHESLCTFCLSLYASSSVHSGEEGILNLLELACSKTNHEEVRSGNLRALVSRR